MSKESECALHKAARKLGEPRGLIMPAKCPYEQTCDGLTCEQMDKSKAPIVAEERFLNRLRKTLEKIKHG